MPVRVSPCHNADVQGSLADGVRVGSCSQCGEDVVRINPRTGAEEWLGTFSINGLGQPEWIGGISPWTTRTDLIPVSQKPQG